MEEENNGGGTSGRRTVDAPPAVDKKLWLCAGLIVMTEGLAFTVILPFVGYLVSALGDWSTATAGYVSGLIMSCMFVGQTVWASRWGRAADQYSSRTVLLGGLTTAALSVLAFGFTKSLWWAVLSRSCLGIFSSNFSNCKALLLSSCKGHKSLEAKASSFIGLVASSGEFLGPVIGGLFYWPCSDASPLADEKWFVKESLFCEYRPLLPCLIVSGIIVLVLLISLLLLPHPDGAKEKPPFGIKEWLGVVISPFSSLVTLVRGNKVVAVSSRQSTATSGVSVMSFRDFIGNNLLRLSVFVFVGCRAANIGFLEVFPLFAIAPQENGGMDWAETDVAIFLSVASIASFIGNILLVPVLGRWSHHTVLKRSLTVLIPLCFAFPALTLANSSPIVTNTRQLTLAATLGIVRNCLLTGFLLPMCNLLLSVASPPGTFSLVQGYAQSSVAVARLITPLAMAPIFAWSISAPHSFPFNHYLSFTLLAVILSTTMFFAFRHEEASTAKKRQSGTSSGEVAAEESNPVLGVEGPRHRELVEPLPFYEP